MELRSPLVGGRRRLQPLGQQQQQHLLLEEEELAVVPSLVEEARQQLPHPSNPCSEEVEPALVELRPHCLGELGMHPLRSELQWLLQRLHQAEEYLAVNNHLELSMPLMWQ